MRYFIFCFCKKIANPTFNAHAGWGGSGWAKLMTWSAKSKINVTFWCCLRMFSNPRPCLQFNTSSPLTQYSGSNVSRGKFLSLRNCSNYLIWRIAQSFFAAANKCHHISWCLQNPNGTYRFIFLTMSQFSLIILSNSAILSINQAKSRRASRETQKPPTTFSLSDVL